MTYAPINSQSNYLPIQFDVPTDALGIRNFVDKRERLTASIVNIKENAIYEKIELLNGQQWFDTQPITASAPKLRRYSYRVVFDMVALKGGPITPGLNTVVLTATTVPPLITNISTPVHIFGSATVAGPKYLPLPYASATNNNIEIWFDNTNPAAQTVNVNNNYGSNLTQCYIVFEYLKQT